MRLSTSRPSCSVPSQCEAEGGVRRVERICLRGFAGARNGANTAMMANVAISTKPATVRGLRRQAGRRGRAGTATVSAMTDSRVQPVISHIYNQIRNRVDQGGE